MKRRFIPVLIAFVIFVLGMPPSARGANRAQLMARRQAAFAVAAGAPVSKFRYTTPLYAWEPLSDRQLVLYTRPDQAYLLNFDSCPDLSIATAIGVTSSVQVISINFDKVKTDRRPFPCVIKQIKPVDLTRFKLKPNESYNRNVAAQERVGG